MPTTAIEVKTILALAEKLYAAENQPPKVEYVTVSCCHTSTEHVEMWEARGVRVGLRRAANIAQKFADDASTADGRDMARLVVVMLLGEEAKAMMKESP